MLALDTVVVTPSGKVGHVWGYGGEAQIWVVMGIVKELHRAEDLRIGLDIIREHPELSALIGYDPSKFDCLVARDLALERGLKLEARILDIAHDLLKLRVSGRAFSHLRPCFPR